MSLLCWSPILGVVGFMLVKYLARIQLRRKLDRWKDTPKDVVILHGFTRGNTAPNNSPFVLKLEVFLRMAKIPYEFDCTDPFGAKGKTPWVSLNGEHVPDSQLAMEFLQKKFQPKLYDSYPASQTAAARGLRVMLEERTFWGFATDRFIWHWREFQKMSAKSYLHFMIYRFVGSLVLRNRTTNHGIGKHSKEDMLKLTTEDLRAVSAFLGDKKFILGDEPCVEDCGIFGQLAQSMWALPNSEYEKLVHGELSNLKGYCLRMKERFYPDWEQCLG